ncbi:hypothetical protein [Haloarchaeobius sp. TZWWS8]|uniref:hypothetical protein n=1 Tax=Haloarchaeobius sp. TZWWS8 TaxID=3446121 RepID=UPI003EC136E5
MNRYQRMGYTIVLAAVGNLTLALATFVAGDGTLLFSVAHAAGSVLLAVVGFGVAADHRHYDWANSPFADHGPALIAGLVGLVGLALFIVGVSKLLAVL